MVDRNGETPHPGRSAASSGRATIGPSPLSVAVWSVVIAAGLVLAVYLSQGGRPDAFVRFGQETQVGQLGKEALGPDLQVTLIEGHDGQYFWLLAHDPLLSRSGPWLDRLDTPFYRSQRILYPALVAPWLLGGEWSLLYGMVITNLVVVFLGALVTANLCRDLGVTTLGGLAFTLNIAVLVSVLFDLTDALMILLLVAMALALVRNRPVLAVVAGGAAGLSKEAAVPVVIALVFGWWFERRSDGDREVRARTAIAVGVASVVPWALWTAYARLRVGDLVGVGRGRIAVGPVPLAGILETMRDGWLPEGRYDDLVVGLVALAISVAIIVRVARRRTMLMWAALPVALSMLVAGPQVYNSGQDPLRVVGAAITFVVIDLLVSRRDPAPIPA